MDCSPAPAQACRLQSLQVLSGSGWGSSTARLRRKKDLPWPAATRGRRSRCAVPILSVSGPSQSSLMFFSIRRWKSRGEARLIHQESRAQSSRASGYQIPHDPAEDADHEHGCAPTEQAKHRVSPSEIGLCGSVHQVKDWRSRVMARVPAAAPIRIMSCSARTKRMDR